jgi:hypothetical protein
MLPKPWSKGVEYGISQRNDKHIVVWEWQFDKMRGDHLANGIGVNQAGKEDEWNEMFVQDDRLQVEVRWDEGPGYEKGYKTEESDSRLLATLVADFDHVSGTGDC